MRIPKLVIPRKGLRVEPIDKDSSEKYGSFELLMKNFSKLSILGRSLLKEHLL